MTLYYETTAENYYGETRPYRVAIHIVDKPASWNCQVLSRADPPYWTSIRRRADLIQQANEWLERKEGENPRRTSCQGQDNAAPS